MGTLVRPDGPVKIECTKTLNGDVLIARLSGAVQGGVAVVKKGKEHYFVAPKSMGGTRKIEDADSLTHGLHEIVFELGMKAEKAQRAEKRKQKGTKEA